MFTKVFSPRTTPAESLVAPKRFGFDLTPKEVAVAVADQASNYTDGEETLSNLLHGNRDNEWTPAEPAVIRAFVAGVATLAQVSDDLKHVLFERGLGEQNYLSLVEACGLTEEHFDAIADGLVDAFVAERTLSHLFPDYAVA